MASSYGSPWLYILSVWLQPWAGSGQCLHWGWAYSVRLFQALPSRSLGIWGLYGWRWHGLLRLELYWYSLSLAYEQSSLPVLRTRNSESFQKLLPYFTRIATSPLQ